MHSVPIDLLVRTPGQGKAALSESDPDGRFSELLRRPPRSEPEPQAAPETGAAEAAAVPDAGPATRDREPVAKDPGPTAPEQASAPSETPAGTEPPVPAPAIVPEAITHPLQATAIGDAVPVATGTAGGSGPGIGPTPEQALAATPIPPATVPGAQHATPHAAASAPSALPHPAYDGPASAAGPIGGTASATPAATVPAGRIAPSGPASAPAVATPSEVAAGDAVDVAAEAPKVATTAGTSPAGATASGDVPVAAMSAAASESARTARQADAVVAADPAAEPEPSDAPDLPAVRAGATPAQKVGGDPNAVAATAATASGPAAAASGGVAQPDRAIADLPPPASQTEPAGAGGPGHAARPTHDAASITQTAAQTASGNGSQSAAAEQVVVQLRRAVASGVDRLTVQLKPASLGRVDVQMEVGFDGRVQAVISADRPETLHLLQRDARSLTTALNDAGLQADSGSLSFNLRGQTGEQAGGNDRLASDGATIAADAAADDGHDGIAPVTLSLGAGRVDIKV